MMPSKLLAALQAAGVSVAVVDGETPSLVPTPPPDLLVLRRAHKGAH